MVYLSGGGVGEGNAIDTDLVHVTARTSSNSKGLLLI